MSSPGNGISSSVGGGGDDGGKGEEGRGGEGKDAGGPSDSESNMRVGTYGQSKINSVIPVEMYQKNTLQERKLLEIRHLTDRQVIKIVKKWTH
jgi:hypothetical protein